MKENMRIIRPIFVNKECLTGDESEMPVESGFSWLMTDNGEVSIACKAGNFLMIKIILNSHRRLYNKNLNSCRKKLSSAALNS